MPQQYPQQQVQYQGYNNQYYQNYYQQQQPIQTHADKPESKKHANKKFLIAIGVSALLIAGLISVFLFSEIKEEDALIKFKSDIARDIKEGISYGSITTKTYELPFSFDEICFVDLDNVDLNEITGHGVIKESVETNSNKNVFLFGKDSIEMHYVEELQLSHYPYYSCIQSGLQNIELTIEGKGSAAVIKTPPSQKYCKNAQDGDLCSALDVTFGSGYESECCNQHNLCC